MSAAVLHWCQQPEATPDQPDATLLAYVRELARRLAREDHDAMSRRDIPACSDLKVLSDDASLRSDTTGG